MKTCDGLVLSTTVANKTENLMNIWFKLKGENTIRNIMKSFTIHSWYYSLELSERKVYKL